MRHSKHLEHGPQSPCYFKISKARQADEPEKNLAVEHALSRKTFGRLLQAVTGRRYLLRLFEGDSCAHYTHYTKGSNSCSSRLSLHFFSPRVH